MMRQWVSAIVVATTITLFTGQINQDLVSMTPIQRVPIAAGIVEPTMKLMSGLVIVTAGLLATSILGILGLFVLLPLAGFPYYGAIAAIPIVPWIIRRRRIWFRVSPYLLGAVIGATVGTIEVIQYTVEYNLDLLGQDWNRLVSVPYHALEGTIIVGSFLSWAFGDRSLPWFLLGAWTTIAFHVGWNASVIGV